MLVDDNIEQAVDNMKKSSATKSQETPWSVRGVSHETRTAAKKAARRSGLTLGEWMERTLQEAAQRELKAKSDQVPAERLEDTLSKIADNLEKQNARLDAIEGRRGLLSFFGWGRAA